MGRLPPPTAPPLPSPQLDDIRAAHAEPAFSARKKTADLSAGPGAGSLFAFDDHGSFPHIDDFGAEGAGTAAVLARQLSRAVAAVVDRVGATQAKDSEGGGSSGAGGGSGSSGDVRRVTRAALTEGTPRAHVEGDDGDDSDTYPLYRALADAGYEPEDALAVLQSEDIPDAIVDIIRDRSRVRPEATAARASARAQCKHLLATTQRVVAELREERERQRVAEAEAAERRLLEEELARQAAEDAEARAELERVQALREEAERRRAAELAAARQLEAARQTKLRRLGTCSMGYPWRRVAGGYVCAGGSHSFLDAQIDAYAE